MTTSPKADAIVKLISSLISDLTDELHERYDDVTVTLHVDASSRRRDWERLFE